MKAINPTDLNTSFNEFWGEGVNCKTEVSADMMHCLEESVVLQKEIWHGPAVPLMFTKHIVTTRLQLLHLSLHCQRSPTSINVASRHLRPSCHHPSSVSSVSSEFTATSLSGDDVADDNEFEVLVDNGSTIRQVKACRTPWATGSATASVPIIDIDTLEVLGEIDRTVKAKGLSRTM